MTNSTESGLSLAYEVTVGYNSKNSFFLFTVLFQYLEKEGYIKFCKAMREARLKEKIDPALILHFSEEFADNRLDMTYLIPIEIIRSQWELETILKALSELQLFE